MLSFGLSSVSAHLRWLYATRPAEIQPSRPNRATTQSIRLSNLSHAARPPLLMSSSRSSRDSVAAAKSPKLHCHDGLPSSETPFARSHWCVSPSSYWRKTSPARRVKSSRLLSNLCRAKRHKYQHEPWCQILKLVAHGLLYNEYFLSVVLILILITYRLRALSSHSAQHRTSPSFVNGPQQSVSRYPLPFANNPWECRIIDSPVDARSVAARA